MRRKWIIAILIVTAATGAIAYQYFNAKNFHFVGTRLKVDLAHPDALIRTTSLSKLPRDLLKLPIARDVLTEDLAFYYEQHEDRLGVNGAIKRIAYEHDLAWSDHIYSSIFNEPAEVAFWRDGKGALRHYAIVMRRSAMIKVLQEALTVSLQDSQLKQAGTISTSHGSANVFALEVNPRRTLLLISEGDQIIALSDPGLLFDDSNSFVSEARSAVQNWLNHPGLLSEQFALDSIQADATKPTKGEAQHTMAIGASTLTLGYGSFMSGFKGVRFDFAGHWSTSIWLDQKALAPAHLLEPSLWSAAPANPSACIILPVDWNSVITVINKAESKPSLPEKAALSALSGSALACWYNESKLFTPVFITKLAPNVPNRTATLEALAQWSIAAELKTTANDKDKDKVVPQLWRNEANNASLGSSADFVIFSPDGALVDKVMDTVARRNPSVADQQAKMVLSIGVITPRALSEMAEREVFDALSQSQDEDFLTEAQTFLPDRMKALSSYPPIRLELSSARGTPDAWQRVEWISKEKSK